MAVTIHRIVVLLLIWWSPSLPLVKVCSTTTTDLDTRQTARRKRTRASLSAEASSQLRGALAAADESVLLPSSLSHGRKLLLDLDAYLRESNAASPYHPNAYYYYEENTLERHGLKIRSSLPKSKKKHPQRSGKGKGSKDGTKTGKGSGKQRQRWNQGERGKQRQKGDQGQRGKGQVYKAKHISLY